MEPIRRRVAPFTQQDLVTYGELHGTNGRIHNDPEFALRSVTQGIVVQGTLVLSAVLDALQRLRPETASKGYELEVRFLSMVRLAEAIDLEIRPAEPGAAWTFEARRPGAELALAGSLSWRT